MFSVSKFELTGGLPHQNYHLSFGCHCHIAHQVLKILYEILHECFIFIEDVCRQIIVMIGKICVIMTMGLRTNKSIVIINCSYEAMINKNRLINLKISKDMLIYGHHQVEEDDFKINTYII